VPFTGATHFGGVSPCVPLQHIVPSPQHEEPQHCSFTAQKMPLQTGNPHVPLSQYGWNPTHACPQPPQLWMSFSSFTHAPLQHV